MITLTIDVHVRAELLEAVGVSATEERLYSALVAVPDADLAELTEATGLSPAEAGAAVHQLQAKGLVERTVGSSSRFSAVPPDVALGPVLAQREDELRATREGLADLARSYREATLSRPSAELVEVISGAPGIRQRFQQIQHQATTEVLALTKPPFLAPAGGNDDELELLARGVSVRSIYDRAALESYSSLNTVRPFLEAGEQARVTEQLPTKLIVVDARTALLPLAVDPRENAQSHALLVHRSTLLDSLVELFEKLWAMGTPLPLDAEPGPLEETHSPPDHIERQILAMMFAGLTDQTVARQLGFSQRTLQRHIRALMDKHGARGRFHLGAIARERGLLG